MTSYFLSQKSHLPCKGHGFKSCPFVLLFNQYLQLPLLQCTDTHNIFNLAKNQSLVCDKLTLHVHLCNFPCNWPKAGIKVLSLAD